MLTCRQFFVVSLLVASVAAALALDNGLALTPPMGWNTWNTFQCNYDESTLKQMAHALISSGMAKAGYTYLNIDDCWQTRERDAQGNLQPDPTKFPNGMKAFVDYIHSLGLKVGIYSDVGMYTCQGFPGSNGYYQQDANTFASWGIDYLKFDTCYLTTEIENQPWLFYGQMSQALNKTGRPIVFSICNWGRKDSWNWAPKIGNLWRTTYDIFPWWGRVLEILDAQKPLYPYAAPGAFNDPDMLEVGVNGTFFNLPLAPAAWLDDTQARSHFSLWAIMAAPLITGNDLRTMRPAIQAILTNTEVIAVNQDPLGLQGRVVASVQSGIDLDGACLWLKCSWTEVWAKNMTNGRIAVVLFNRAGVLYDLNQWGNEDVTVTWTQLGLSSSSATYRATDLWSGQALGDFTGQFAAKNLAPHAVQFILLDPRV